MRSSTERLNLRALGKSTGCIKWWLSSRVWEWGPSSRQVGRQNKPVKNYEVLPLAWSILADTAPGRLRLPSPAPCVSRAPTVMLSSALLLTQVPKPTWETLPNRMLTFPRAQSNFLAEAGRGGGGEGGLGQLLQMEYFNCLNFAPGALPTGSCSVLLSSAFNSALHLCRTIFYFCFCFLLSIYSHLFSAFQEFLITFGVMKADTQASFPAGVETFLNVYFVIILQSFW